MRRPDLPSRRALALALPGLPLLGLAARSQRAGAQGDSEPVEPRAPAALSFLILLRHAEKDPAGDPADPGLSATGRDRAQALARLLAPSGIDRLYASEFARTRQTLQPLSAACGVEVEILPAARTAEVIARLAALPPGSVAVLAGHSNTIPPLLAGLGCRPSGVQETTNGLALPDGDYGRLFVVALGSPARADGEPAGPAGDEKATPREVALLELAYGA